jgi:hypothetical protein
MRIAFAAARSSPGVTTAMLALASVWPGKVLLVEASEDGGALAARFGLRLEPGLTTLAAAIRNDATVGALDQHTQTLPDTRGRLVALVGPATPESAQLLLRTAASRLSDLLRAVDGADVFIDAGRLAPSSAAGPLLADADRTVLVARPRVEELQTLAHRLPLLRDAGIEPEVLLVGSRPYGPDDVAASVGVPVIGSLAVDRKAAEALGGAGASGRLGRSVLLRSAASLVPLLMEQTSADTAPAAGVVQ